MNTIHTPIIDLKELRIGSLLIYKGKLVHITMLDIDLDDESMETIGFCEYGTTHGQQEGWNRALVKDLSRIPLSKEWLEKMGCKVTTFEEEDTALVDIPRLFVALDYSLKENSLKINEFIRKLKYVHEFQNFYFAFTGEEAIINEQP